MSLLNDLKAAKQAISNEAPEEGAIVGKYAGHACENEMSQLDVLIEVFEIGTEGENPYADIEIAAQLSAAVNEEGKIDVSKIGLEGFGIEKSMKEIASGAYTKSKDFAKRMVRAILGLIRRMVSAVTTKQLIVSKYAEILSKLKTELGELNIPADNKDEITYKDYGKLATLVAESEKLTPTQVDNATNEINGSTSWTELFENVSTALVIICNYDVTSLTSEKVKEDLKKKVILNKFVDIVKANTNSGKITKDINTAKRALSSLIDSVIPKISGDISLKKPFETLIQAIQSKQTSITKVETEGGDVESEKVIVQKAAAIVVQAQAGYTVLFKEVNGSLASLAKDCNAIIKKVKKANGKDSKAEEKAKKEAEKKAKKEENK